jgi:HlyD family secretion protein
MPKKLMLPENRKFLALAGGGLILLGAVAWYFTYGAGRRGDNLELYGNVDIREVNLAFMVEGRIDRLVVDEGDKVVAGQLLASLEKGYIKDNLAMGQAQAKAQLAVLSKLEKGNRAQEIAKARADVGAVKAQQTNAQLDYERQKILASHNNASKSRLDQAKAAMDQADAQLGAARQALSLMEAGFRSEDVRQAEAQYEAAEAQVSYDARRLKDADIFAPADGTILTRVREPGSIVTAGQPIYDLALTRPIWVRAYVSETKLGQVLPGMMAEITADSLPGKTYQGQVGFISPTAEFTPKSVETTELRTSLVYRLRIVVANPDENLRQGMPVTVRLNLKAGN